MYQGYIKLYRSSQDNVLYFSEPFTKRQARQDMILLTNHKDGIIVVRGNIIEVKRGQLGYSEDTISMRWKWSRNKVRRFLNYLETIQQIEQHKSKVKSIISIKNYEKYQGNGTTDDTTERQQTIQQTDTNKNDKNDKNDKNEKEKKNTAPVGATVSKRFVKPTLELVQEYCESRNNGIDADAFLAHYDAVGWVYGKDRKPIKDWKACIRTREQKRKEEEKKKEPQTMEQWRELRDKMGIRLFTEKYGNEQAQKIMLYFL